MDTAGLWQGERQCELLPLFCHIKLALSPVSRARHLNNIAGVDELLKHTRQTLLGDAQNIQQFSNSQPRPVRDEVQHAVMGAAETVADQNVVRIRREVAIGEENKLDQGEIDQFLVAR